MTKRWSNLVRHGLLGTSLAGLAAAPAAAEPCDDVASETVALVIGLNLSPRPGLVGGIEARRCVRDDAEVMVRFELGGGAPRVIAGGRIRPFEKGTDEMGESLGFEGGLGIDTLNRLALHAAVTQGSHSAYAALQGWLGTGGTETARVSLVGGLAPWTLQGPMVVEGRPLHVDGHLVRPALARLPRARSAEARAARDHFASSAQYEQSSVWTFLRLAAELAAVGAPAALVARALDAADDEVRHAELCAAAAGGVVLAELPRYLAQPRFTARSPRALAILADEAWRDGCLNETAAAEEARLAAAEAAGPIAAALATIARDEAGHAALSWDVLAWVAAVAPHVVASLDHTLPRVQAGGAGDAALVRRGVPSPAMTAAAWAFAAATARDRLATIL